MSPIITQIVSRFTIDYGALITGSHCTRTVINGRVEKTCDAKFGSGPLQEALTFFASIFINTVSEDEVGLGGLVTVTKSCKPRHSKHCQEINIGLHIGGSLKSS